MTKQKTVIFIVADEVRNGGERDYMASIAAEINANKDPNKNYLVLKIQTENTGFPANASEMTGNPAILPVTNKEYKDVPVISKDYISSLNLSGDDDVELIGVGNSTLQTIVDAQKDLKNCGSLTTSYVTHMVDGKKSLQQMVDANITKLFCTIEPEDLQAIDEELAKQVTLYPMDAVPHTNSRASCLLHYDLFMATENGQKVQRIIDAKEDFAFVVLNAGFGVGEPKVPVPYTEQEARKHARALSKALGKRTNLVLSHGGPRNVNIDEAQDQHTIDAFTEEYLEAQAEYGDTPEVIQERYEDNLAHNAVKAGYILAEDEHCKGYISNSEGYGTMDGATIHIDNKKKLVAMFSFGAHFKDVTKQRQKNIMKYFKAGIAVITSTGEVLHSVEEKPTPYQQRDAAQQIVNTLKLAA